MSYEARERRRLHEELAASERRYRATFEQAAVGVARIALDGTFLEVNQRFCDIAGWSQEELRARRYADITHPDDVAADAALAEGLIHGRVETGQREKRYLRKDGHPVWVSLAPSLVRDEDGQPDYFVAVVEDVDRRARAEQEVRERRARHEAERRRLVALMDHNPAEIYHLDTDLVIVSASVRGGERTAEELAGRGYFDVYPDPELEALFARARDTGRPDRGAERLYRDRERPECGVTYWDWDIVPVEDEQGVVVSLMLSVLDVTERVLQGRLTQALVDVVEAAGTSLVPAHVVQRLADRVMGLVEADSWAAWALEGGSWRRQPPAEANGDAESRVIAAADAVPAARAHARRRPLAVDDASDAGVAALRLLATGSTRSALLVPLAPVGAPPMLLVFAWEERSHTFSKAELDFAARVADAATGLLEKARLHQELADRERQLREETETLTAILGSSLAAEAFLDADLRFIAVNQPMQMLLGRAGVEFVGRRCFDLFPLPPLEEAFEEALESGRVLEMRDMLYPIAGRSAEQCSYLDVKATPVRTAGGPSRGLVVSLVDVTDRVQAERFATALGEVQAIISSTLAREQVLERLLGAVAVVLGAEAAVVGEMRDDEIEIVAERGLGHDVLGRSFPRAQVPLLWAAGGPRDVQVVEDCDDDPRVPTFVSQKFGVRSLLAIPLTQQGRTWGELLFGFRSSPRGFPEAELEFARRVGESASTSLENARLYADVLRQQELGDELVEINAILGSTLEAGAVMPAVCERARRAMGSESTTVVIREGEVWTPAYTAGPASRFLAGPASEVQLSPLWSAIPKGRELHVDDSTRQSGAQHEQLRLSDTRSLLYVPLTSAGTLLGGLFFTNGSRPHAWSRHEVVFAEKLAAGVAMSVQNSRLFATQRGIARTLQENFIHPLPEVEGLELAAVSEPAHLPELIGGDFHDVFELPDGRVAVLLGDVQGKGIKAAGLTETVRSAVRALVVVSPSPRYVLNNVNRLLLHEQLDDFVTALLMLLDPESGEILAASAGQPSPVLVTAAGARVSEVDSGPPLGTFPWDYEIHRLTLAREDSLVAYTDGVIEARRGGELFAEEGVVQTLAALGPAAGPEQLAEALAEAAREYSGRLQDDLQVVAVRFLGRSLAVGQSALPRLKMTVPMAPWRLTDVRDSARDFLTAHEVPDQVTAEVVLCIEEACVNALRHSGSLNPTDLTLCIRDEAVEAVVQDDGVGFDVGSVDLGRPPDLMAAGGRGLYLIHSLVDELQVSCDGGTRVTMKRSLHRLARSG